ncbi:MAG: FMN-binding negative transcriptional regulator [Bacteroidetes bacterium]|nr:MAG: FMN-binding negative transcriptional regulator [Bacteroidota bacterium]
MYIPKHFRNENIDQVREFIKANSFGILVSQTEGNLFATHIPLELDQNEAGKDILCGHISKANPQWRNFKSETEVLAIFSGSHTYISSSWYDHENVPTWNYMAVHVRGKIQIIEGEKLMLALKKLVDKYESASENPVSIEKMSSKMLEKEIKGIIAFEIEIEKIEAAYKLSQNRDAKNHENIIKELEKRGDENSLKVAEQMGKGRK